jgi:Pentapeptide repeats (8 copies)
VCGLWLGFAFKTSEGLRRQQRCSTNRERKRVPRPARAGPDPKEAEALAAALNHSAERVQTLWFSFLIFMVYLAIAAGTTTHRMLFLESPLNLPVLNIALPLRGFYILAPIIFVVFHFYMLLSLVLLARTAKSFEDALVDTFPHDYDAREKFRMRIENTLFVQLLVGGKLERAGITANLLELIAIFTLIAAPIQTIFMIQTMFLPYHSWPITWLHRVLLYLDLWFLIALWEGYRSTWGVWSLPKWYWFFDESWIARAGAGVLVLACLVATFPDEPMYFAGMVWLEPRHNSFGPPQANTFNTLDLHGEDLIYDEKLARIVKKNENPEQGPDSQRWIATLSLAGRNLTGANLSGADIRHADFSHSILNRAFIDNVWAENADFTAVIFKDASLNFARMTGARLDFAVLKRRSSNLRNFRGHPLSTPISRAPISTKHISKAQISKKRKLMAEPSATRSFRARGLTMHSFKLQISNVQILAARDSQLHTSRVPCLRERIFRERSSPPQSFKVPCWIMRSFRALRSIMCLSGEQTHGKRIGWTRGLQVRRPAGSTSVIRTTDGTPATGHPERMKTLTS